MDFPSELSMFFTSTFKSARPNVSIKWITPDGREIRLTDMSIRNSESYRISQDNSVSRRVRGLAPEVGLLLIRNDPSKVNKGTYKVVVEGLVFEEGSTLDGSCSLRTGSWHGWNRPSPPGYWRCVVVGNSGCPVLRVAGSCWFVPYYNASCCGSSLVWRVG